MALSWIRHADHYPERRVDADLQFRPCSKQVEPLPHSLLGWIPHIIRTPARTILQKNGLDAYIFVRFLFLMLEIFFPL